MKTVHILSPERCRQLVHQMKLWLLSAAAILLIPVAAHCDDLIVNANNSLEWNQKEAFYHASGKAEALQGSQEIRADSLKAFYNPQTNARTITRIIVCIL